MIYGQIGIQKIYKSYGLKGLNRLLDLVPYLQNVSLFSSVILPTTGTLKANISARNPAWPRQYIISIRISLLVIKLPPLTCSPENRLHSTSPQTEHRTVQYIICDILGCSRLQDKLNPPIFLQSPLTMWEMGYGGCSFILDLVQIITQWSRLFSSITSPSPPPPHSQTQNGKGREREGETGGQREREGEGDREKERGEGDIQTHTITEEWLTWQHTYISWPTCQGYLGTQIFHTALVAEAVSHLLGHQLLACTSLPVPKKYKQNKPTS